MCRVSMQPMKRTRLDAMCDEEPGEEADEDDSQPSKRQRLEYEILAEHHQALNRNLERRQQGEASHAQHRAQQVDHVQQLDSPQVYCQSLSLEQK